MRTCLIINYQHLGCKIGQESWLVYDEEAHEGKSEVKSTQDLETGIYCGCRRLPGRQTSSQTCPEIPDTTVNRMEENKFH
jgi:hypothetical protein